LASGFCGEFLANPMVPKIRGGGGYPLVQTGRIPATSQNGLAEVCFCGLLRYNQKLVL
jgi:hypothetical protein